MATPDKVPAEESVDRAGPQLTADEARAVAHREGTLPGAPSTDALPASAGGRDPHPNNLFRYADADREVPQVPQVDAATAPGERGRGASGAGRTSSNPQNTNEMMHPEAALGGADSVQKTSWGVGTGTEPDGRAEYAPVGLRKGEGSIVARTSPGGGINPIAWIVGFLALVIAVVYGFGILRG
jgi:hypothetical protein